MDIVGAWARIPEPERKCLICKGDFVEDAEHFVSKCTFYADLRDDCRRCLLQAIDGEQHPDFKTAVEDSKLEAFLGDKLLSKMPDVLRTKLDSIICCFLKRAWRRRETVWKSLCRDGNEWQLR